MAPTTNLKRKLNSKSSGKSKRIHLDRPEKKRSLPVTAKLQPPAASGTESDDDELEPHDAEGEWEDDEEDEYAMDVAEDVPQNAAKSVTKDPNAARESHKAQKVIQNERKAAKPHSDIMAEAKRVWSEVRQKDVKPAGRQKLVQELMSIIRGKVKEIVFKHDASRIVQSVVKYGTQKDREEIAVELKGKFKELAQNKYSKFLVTKLIRFCSARRLSILAEFQPFVLRLLLHREATTVLADSFELYANSYERSILLREFYGKEATLFTITSGSTEGKEQARKGLQGYLEGADIDRKRRILSALKQNLTTIFNNPDKGALTHAIVHRALWEYLQGLGSLPEGEEREKARREIFEICQDVLAEMVHTKDGSRVVREFLAHGSAKDRKQILKVLKPHIERMCLDDEAQLVLFTALDVTDDTKLLSKSVVSEIVGAAEKLYPTVQGRRALLYLIVPRSRRHFTPSQITSIADTDDIRALTSKKSVESRQSEVCKFASEGLLPWVQEGVSTLIRDPGASLIITDLLLYGDGDKSDAIASLLSAIAIPYPMSELARNGHPIDLAITSRIYKTLLQGGHYNHKSQSIELASGDRWNPVHFATEFVKVVGQGVVLSTCTKGMQNGCFVVAELCQAFVTGDDSEGRQTLKRWFSAEDKKVVEESDAKGKKVLLEKLALL